MTESGAASAGIPLTQDAHTTKPWDSWRRPSPSDHPSAPGPLRPTHEREQKDEQHLESRVGQGGTVARQAPGRGTKSASIGCPLGNFGVPSGKRPPYYPVGPRSEAWAGRTYPAIRVPPPAPLGAAGCHPISQMRETTGKRAPDRFVQTPPGLTNGIASQKGVGEDISPTALPHHRTCGSASGGSVS